MYVHRSNRMEGLVDELAVVLRRPSLSVLAQEVILIQSQGMERWLSRELARRLGSFANARFPFPRAFIRDAMDAVLGPAPEAVLFERETMTWAVAALLPELSSHKAFAPVKNYLGEDPGAVRRLQLAERIAYLFDQYVIYRPKLVLGWEAGKGSDWQAVLWRALVERYDRVDAEGAPQATPRETPRAHFAARAAAFERNFSPLFVQRGALPARLCVVGGASLPPLFLRLLAKLAECVELHLFCLAPTREYLGQASKGSDALAWSTPREDVHPLLASLGDVGAAFQQLLERDIRYVDGDGDFVEVPSDSVLHALQSDLLNNRQRGAGERLPRPRPGQDDSVSLVSCHSPMREVEVLRDRLLGLFDADPTLRPDDVVVMAPRIDAYVPLIEAVFSGDGRSPDAIPYRIADRSERSSNPAAEGFLQVLEVLSGRLKASEVLDLLQCAPIRRRFRIEAADLPAVYRWVHDSGIRWGQDAAHREEYGLPAEAANTWSFGLRRLLLGYAMADDESTVFCDVVPQDPADGDRLELLGRFVRFCETLFAFRPQLRGRRPVASWCELLRELAGAFLAEEGALEWQLGPVYLALHDLENAARLAGFEEPVALEGIASRLAERFDADTSSTDFVAGGVTFCAMLPMRSIPFRVVYVLGMNDGEYPRVESQLGFDKMAERPELGDRSQRQEDRYLFLETLVSARDRLILSYLGRGIQDNQQRPPAVVVTELAAAIEQLLCPPGLGEAEYLAPAHHPLQPFSPQAFDGSDPRLASYSDTYASGARALALGPSPVRPFFSESPLPDAEQGTVIELEELVAFFKNPARALLRRLGVRLDEDLHLVEDREHVESDALMRYAVGSRLLAAPEAALSAVERAELGRGALPLGAPGRVLLASLGDIAGGLRRTTATLTAGGVHPPIPLSVRLPMGRHQGTGLAEPAFELVGALEGVYWSEAGARDGQLRVRLVSASYARLGAKYELAAWVRHLAARAAETPVAETWIVGRAANDTVVLKRFGEIPASRARELLADLAALYRAGLRNPLPFFPTASRKFADRVRANPADTELEKKGLAAALHAFADAPAGGEGGDVHVAWAFRGMNPFEPPLAAPADGAFPSFVEVSRRVFLPLLDCLEEVSTESGGDA
jgi:exodeoxyribonuclease V gamma subunit